MTKVNTDRIVAKIPVIIGLLSAIYILQLIKIFFSDGLLQQFQSSRWGYDGFPKFVQGIYLFILPCCIVLFNKHWKSVYYLLVFYLSFSFMSKMTEALFLLSNLPSIEWSNVVDLFILVLMVFSFFHLSQPTFISDFGVRANAISIVFVSSLICVFLSNYYFILNYVILVPAIIVLLLLIPVWDYRLLKNNKLEAETAVPISEIFRIKRKLTLLPFLILIPYVFLIEKILLGPAYSLSDHMWSNKHYVPNKYYDFIMYLFLSLPAFSAFIWFNRLSEKRIYLKRFALNFVLTFLLNYLLIALFYAIFLLINGTGFQFNLNL